MLNLIEPDFSREIAYEESFDLWCKEKSKEFESFVRYVCSKDEFFDNLCFSLAYSMDVYGEFKNQDAASEEEAICWLFTKGYVDSEEKKENKFIVVNRYERRAKEFFDEYLSQSHEYEY
jgi:hypothetical protein